MIYLVFYSSCLVSWGKGQRTYDSISVARVYQVIWLFVCNLSHKKKVFNEQTTRLLGASLEPLIKKIKDGIQKKRITQIFLAVER